MEKCVTERFWKAGMEEAQELNLRKACWSDCRFLFRLRNEDEVRKNSFQTSEIPYSSHENWFAQKLQDFNTVIYILERNGQAIGQVRADRQERTAEISYALCREARGRGLSRWMLSELENRLREDGFCNELYAEVKRENTASQKIFRSLGYRQKPEKYGFSYTKQIPLYSILMCTYHSSMTLGNALDSARHQTCQNWELVILDNGSKDETITVLQEYERIDERIHVIYRDSNVGWRKGISLCLEKASGQYMMFLGADDYLTKPFAIEELLARMRVAFKHAHAGGAKKVILEVQGLEIDTDKRMVTVNGTVVDLTKKEYELLLYLVQNKNIVLSREQILNEVWGYSYIGETNVVDVYIRYLRSKIDEAFGIKYIHTIRGVGYYVKDE